MTRKDNDYTIVPDTGCPDLNIPSCLSCPLPKCRYDVEGGARAILNSERDRAIVRLHDSGDSVDQLAADFNVSRRSVFRILQENGRGEPVEHAVPYSETEFRKRYDRGETVSVRTEADGSRVIVVSS